MQYDRSQAQPLPQGSYGSAPPAYGSAPPAYGSAPPDSAPEASAPIGAVGSQIFADAINSDAPTAPPASAPHDDSVAYPSIPEHNQIPLAPAQLVSKTSLQQQQQQTYNQPQQTYSQPLQQQQTYSQPLQQQQAYSQPLQQQQSVLQYMMVTCPPGYQPGQSLIVMVNGKQMKVCIPQGVYPGQSFKFAVPVSQVQHVQPLVQQQYQVVQQPVVYQQYGGTMGHQPIRGATYGQPRGKRAMFPGFF